TPSRRRWGAPLVAHSSAPGTATRPPRRSPTRSWCTTAAARPPTPAGPTASSSPPATTRRATAASNTTRRTAARPIPTPPTGSPIGRTSCWPTDCGACAVTAGRRPCRTQAATTTCTPMWRTSAAWSISTRAVGRAGRSARSPRGARRQGRQRALQAAGRSDYLHAYVEHLGSVVDLDAIRRAGVRIGADPLGGAAVDYWAEIGEMHDLDLTVVNPEVDPQWSFMTLDRDGKIRMDCSSPWAMAS